MSSMRNRNRPPQARARSKFSSAEKAWPRWRNPFGDGAKRKTDGGMAEDTRLTALCVSRIDRSAKHDDASEDPGRPRTRDHKPRRTGRAACDGAQAHRHA